jgi:hypothetical protein
MTRRFMRSAVKTPYQVHSNSGGIIKDAVQMEKQRTEELPQQPVPALSNLNTESSSQTHSQPASPAQPPHFSQTD